MKKIKERLIHLLGGMTLEEYQLSNGYTFAHARVSAVAALKQYADSLNGMNADEWCKTMYNHLCEVLEVHKKILD